MLTLSQLKIPQCLCGNVFKTSSQLHVSRMYTMTRCQDKEVSRATNGIAIFHETSLPVTLDQLALVQPLSSVVELLWTNITPKKLREPQMLKQVTALIKGHIRKHLLKLSIIEKDALRGLCKQVRWDCPLNIEVNVLETLTKR